MSKLVLPKATTEVRETATPVAGEIFYDQDKQAVFFGDGATMGGISLKAGSMSTAYVYGIDHDTSVATAATACKRVVLNHDHDQMGDVLRYTQVTEFAQMPAHNFKRCVMSDLANRVVAYYLNASDSTKKENGQTAILTGADGDVMVEIPVCHFRLDTYTDASNHVHNVYLVSNRAFNGSAIHRYFYTSPGGATARVQYVGAFCNVVCDANGTAIAQEADNTPVVFASGRRLRSIAGVRPVGNMSVGNSRTGAKNNNASLVNAMFYQYLMLMMAIDAGSLDTQNISIGYSQISAFKYSALRVTGRTSCFGNKTGEILADEVAGTGKDLDLLTMADSGGTIWKSSVEKKVVKFSYRGIEDPFGPQVCFVEAIQKYQNATEGDFSQSGYWCTNDTNQYEQFSNNLGYGALGSIFPTVGYTGSSLVWVSHPFPKVEGYIKKFDPITFLPLDLNGASTTYLPDYCMGNKLNAESLVVYGGGSAERGDRVGAAGLYLTLSKGSMFAYCTSRCAA